MDSVHPTQATKVSHGWIRTGKTKNVHTSASKTRINLVGAIHLNQLSHVQLFEYDTVNADAIVHFLGHLREQYSLTGKIHLIVDKVGYHRALKVNNEAKRLNIKLHYLPPYRPNLNPIDRLWKVMNEYARNNRFFKEAKDFREALCHFFKIHCPKFQICYPVELMTIFKSCKDNHAS